MFHYASIFVTFTVCGLCGVLGSTTCPPVPTHNPLHQKGEVCLVELAPVLEHIAKNNKNPLWNSGDETKLNETRKQLVRIEGVEVETKDKVKAIQKKMETEFKDLEKKIPKNEVCYECLEKQVEEAKKALYLSMEGKKVIRRNEIPPIFKKIGYSHLYIEKKETADWFTATSKCHKLGGHLATIQNEVELNAIHNEVNIRERIWLGITDLAKFGDWVSLSTGTTPTFLKWAKHSPEAETNQRCLFLEGEMKDGSCSQKYIYICEY
ncbi:accessory gland protein Acp29AB [Drosophila biarmipes]|uniref:accessory gland protein Acp29AB n=1 Tax=Drosophila biarmipes TaxID=125945 RepID=UPI0007E7BC09|nr:accessory gland protein Acp29AB [Drosophila biarmipes]